MVAEKGNGVLDGCCCDWMSLDVLSPPLLPTYCEMAAHVFCCGCDRETVKGAKKETIHASSVPESSRHHCCRSRVLMTAKSNDVMRRHVRETCFVKQRYAPEASCRETILRSARAKIETILNKSAAC